MSGDVCKLIRAGNVDGLASAMATLGDDMFLHRDNRGHGPVHVAIISNQLSCLELLTQARLCDLDLETFDGLTPLMLACQRLPETLEIVRFLLRKKVRVNLKDDKRMTALHHAVSLPAPALEPIKWLVRCGADINALTLWLQSPLMAMLDMEHQDDPVCFDIAKYLHKHGANLSLKDETDRNALGCAICHSKYSMSETLLDLVSNRSHVEASEFVNEYQGVYPTLSLACMKDDLPLSFVQKLLDSGANPNLVTKDSNLLPLHIAYQRGRPDVAKLLLPKTDYRSDVEPPLFHALVNDLGQDLLNSGSPFAIPDQDVMKWPQNENPPGHYALRTVLSAWLATGDPCPATLTLMVTKGWRLNAIGAKFIPPLVALTCFTPDFELIKDCLNVFIKEKVTLRLEKDLCFFFWRSCPQTLATCVQAQTVHPELLEDIIINTSQFKALQTRDFQGLNKDQKHWLQLFTFLSVCVSAQIQLKHFSLFLKVLQDFASESEFPFKDYYYRGLVWHDILEFPQLPLNLMVLARNKIRRMCLTQGQLDFQQEFQELPRVLIDTIELGDITKATIGNPLEEDWDKFFLVKS